MYNGFNSTVCICSRTLSVNENSNSFSFGCSTCETLYRNINIRIPIYVEISFSRLANCLFLYRFCFPLY